MVKQLFENEFIILDGAMGTMLQKSGLPLGERPEILNLTNPELITSIHKAYIDAGANIIYSNTFGANAHKLDGTGYDVETIITAAIHVAKNAAKETGAYVALDIGPIGELLEPSGTLSFEDAYDIFKEMILIGASAGADLIVFETMTDLYEIKAAVLAAKEHSTLPIFVTMTFEENGRTFTGCGIENMAMTLQGLGVDAIGLNCSLGPVEILPLIKQLSKATNLPLIAKPNAGLPDPETGVYNVNASQFGTLMTDYAKAGVQILGGCCGTTSEFIASLKDNLKGLKRGPSTYLPCTRFCSSTNVVTVDTVRVIGERLNPTGKKRFANALQTRDMSFILNQAMEQVDAGADILDLNVGIPDYDEATLMTDMVKSLQSVVSTPLQIDSSKLDALEAGLRVYNGKPILNSVNGEDDKLASILPLAKKYGAAIVGLTIDQDGVPKTAKKRVDIASKIITTALSYGIEKEDILIDCLTLTVSAQQKDCMDTLRAMSIIKETFGVQLVLGVSNISFGLPNRELLNQSFLSLAMSHGLTLPIINPNVSSMMDAIYAYRVLTNYDTDCVDYINHFASVKSQTLVSSVSHGELSLEEAILKGLGEQVRCQTTEALKTTSPLDIVNKQLIPTLDLVGTKYENGEFFLPQLIRSASASCQAFDVIKAEISKTSQTSISKGKIILATVKGDIHDIGKNIVKVILENYGYEIIDLGKDVPPQLVVDTAIAQKVSLVGLSALMTTTVESMKETISLLKASNHPCEIMVGGAVLTADYAAKIGAHYYGKDAKASVDIAKKVLG